jgi:SPP1 gp7 family putative phage head morphogenesis protein
VTIPLPYNMDDDYDVLRRRWLNRYITNQNQTDTRIRTILIEGADDAEKRISALESNSTFSAGVRSAQIRMTMNEVKIVLKDVFGATLPVIKDGQKKTAVSAVQAFSETDRKYLERAFSSTGRVNDFIAGQKLSAQLGIAHAISRVTKTQQPLSTKVYRSQALANNWVHRVVTSSIMRGDSAKDIAKQVRNSIRPSTPGGASYAALRLGRTELNNAFHATSIALSQDRPWVEGMAWNLSKVHTNDTGRVEICEKMSGLIYPVDSVPPKPHPQCRCFVTPQLEPFETFARHLTAGYYREWVENVA